MPRRRIGRWMAVLLAAAVAVLAPVPALTPAAEAAEPNAPLQATVDQYLARALNVTWYPCEDDLLTDPRSSCAKVAVPRDWQNPAAGELNLAVAYLPASGPSKGLLTANPGGPGVEGLLFTESLARSKKQLRQYDLLGFDPRGFGASSTVGASRTKVRLCLADAAKLKKLPKVADRRVRSRATHRVEVAEAKLFGEACSHDSLARYINTQQTVWDLDFLRQLMAARYNKGTLYDKLNYIGYSYGTWLGTWYADTFPANVGRFVLDSNMSWTTTMYVNQTLDSKSFQRRRDKMFFPYVARHHRDFGLGKTTSKVKKKYESIRKQLAKQAAKDLKKGRAVTFGPEDLDYVVSSLIYSNELFPAAGYITEVVGDYAKKPSSSKYRKALAKRVKAPMTKAPFVVQRSSKSVRGSALKDISDGLAGTIVRCNDSATPGNIKSMLKRADSDAKRYPFTGYLNTVPLCAYWKYKPQTRTIDLAGLSSKMLMIQSEGDPATAYEGALASHRKTASKTVLVSVDNEGQHGLYIDGPSTCVEKIGDTFLFSGRLPSRDTRCTTSPLPYDKRVYTLNGPVSGAKSTAKKSVKPKNSAVKAVRTDVAKRGIS